MKKKWICSLTILALCVTSVGYSREVPEEFTAETEEQASEYDDETADDQDMDEEDETFVNGTPVNKEVEGGPNPEKTRRWQNLAIAAGAIAVAVTALVLVGQHDGHH